ncbi:hypothetical protein [Bradyrhizobium sp. F1.13.3]|uniref:hypothetical protein n=1 Tax=Bradyrhizobium sp. F1.13.3 TaxID=3156351 RepID=UPI003399595F
MKATIQTTGGAAEIETDVESAKRLVAFVLAAKRLNAGSFAQAIDRVRFAINTKYSVEGREIIAETWFTHPDVNEEAFESFALRLRPIIYERDVCHFEKVISISRSMFANVPATLAGLTDIETLYHSERLTEQLSKMEALAEAVKTSKWPVVNLWNVVFGGNFWMRRSYHDELFRYGFLYHWNAQGDKWMQYREIEKAAGGRENVLRCMIPFFQCHHLAITRLQQVLIPALQALGLGAEIESGMAQATDDEKFADPSESDTDLVQSKRDMSEPAEHGHVNNEESSVLDVLGMVRSLLPGQHLIERHSWAFREGEMKRTLSLEASEGVQPPPVRRDRPMQIAPVGMMIDIIPAGQTSVTLEATPYISSR